MPEWLMGTDCKSVGLPTLVQIQFGPIDKRGCGGMVDTGDLKSPAGDGVRVQFPPATIQFTGIRFKDSEKIKNKKMFVSYFGK